jgi:phosphoribosylformylglycinamidine synthase subunit PurQ / glutaminase
MTVAVVTFPGSNCDRDCVTVMQNVVGAPACHIWHGDMALPAETRAVILPGGFSYGDYLRAGAMARVSPIMAAVKAFAENGGPVLGICNGFQILCEIGLLPGALLPNQSGRFICRHVRLVAGEANRGLLAAFKPGQELVLPIAHGEGNYFADDETLNQLEAENRIAFKYVEQDHDGHATVNGSRRSIAGLIGGPKNNILGLMPHPERRAENRLGGIDGLPLMQALVSEGLS